MFFFQPPVAQIRRWSKPPCLTNNGPQKTGTFGSQANGPHGGPPSWNGMAKRTSQRIAEPATAPLKPKPPDHPPAAKRPKVEEDQEVVEIPLNPEEPPSLTPVKEEEPDNPEEPRNLDQKLAAAVAEHQISILSVHCKDFVFVICFFQEQCCCCCV